MFEELVWSRRDHSAQCPRCGKTKVKQLVSVFAAQTGARAASTSGDCYNRRAGICEAGGGALT